MGGMKNAYRALVRESGI